MIGLLAVIILYVALMAIQIINKAQDLKAIISVAFQLVGWIVCLPFIRAYFAIEVNRDGIKGPSSLVPVFSQRVVFKWELIKGIKVHNFLLFSFIELEHIKSGQTLVIPVGLDHYSIFLKCLLDWSPENCPIRLLILFKNKRANELKSIKVQLSGLCHWPTQKIVPYTPVLLMKNQIIIDRTKADPNGKFYLETHLIPGEYTLAVQSSEYFGELKVSLEKSYLQNLILPLKRK